MAENNTLVNDGWQNLFPHHEEMLLTESGIAPEVVKEREYRSIGQKAELRCLGFSEAQRNAPGLLVPVWGVNGEVAAYQYRPDQPRSKNGNLVKYETPPGTRMVLDVHPIVRKMLGDPKVPLLITEGVKKGDALVSRGLCAVALMGVWNWRGRNEDGGLTALAEWESVALNGDRPVSIIYDSDVMKKPAVYKALVRLKSFLESR
ncbi:MAG: DUF3854 domain-containing protein [Actinomycetota bacterium]|nr:DUF3854 domain-containing protein [Actinomycetota bacterium]